MRCAGRVREKDPDVLEPERAMDDARHLDDPRDLFLNLRRGAEDVGIVLRKRAHAREPVQHARFLVAMKLGEIGVAQRQLAVRALGAPVDERVSGAVHRLHAELALVDLAEEHVVAEVLVVPRALPELDVGDLRSDHLAVAVTLVEVADEGDQRVVDERALRVKERAPRRDRMKAPEVELLAELAMVAPLGFLEELEMALQLRLGRPRGAVDPLQHRVLLVAPPIGAGDAGQLECAELPVDGTCGPRQRSFQSPCW